MFCSPVDILFNVMETLRDDHGQPADLGDTQATILKAYMVRDGKSRCGEVPGLVVRKAVGGAADTCQVRLSR